MAPAEEGLFSGRTLRALSVQAPLRRFLRTETGSASILVAATLIALVWANAAGDSYQGLWHARLSVQIGPWGVSQNLVSWVNGGLMAFFFFVVGLEVRREVDLDELRERRRVAQPLLSDAGGIAGILGASWLVTRLSGGRLRPPVGWATLAGGGAVAGIGFTVSLLIATLAFQGPQLQEAKLGILTAVLASAGLSFVAFRAAALLPARLRARALLGTPDVIVDLSDPVDPERDHVRGAAEAPVTLVEYGDFECPYCGQAEPVVRELLRDTGDLRYVWRHLPLNDVHPHAQLAAEAAEAAAAQGAFWAMHELLLTHQDALRPGDLMVYAAQLGLDVERFDRDLRLHAGAGQVSADAVSADLSGVSGTPTFFINGHRHAGAYDIDSLSRAIRAARARSALAHGTSG